MLLILTDELIAVSNKLHNKHLNIIDSQLNEIYGTVVSHILAFCTQDSKIKQRLNNNIQNNYEADSLGDNCNYMNTLTLVCLSSKIYNQRFLSTGIKPTIDWMVSWL